MLLCTLCSHCMLYVAARFTLLHALLYTMLYPAACDRLLNAAAAAAVSCMLYTTYAAAIFMQL